MVDTRRLARVVRQWPPRLPGRRRCSSAINTSSQPPGGGRACRPATNDRAAENRRQVEHGAGGRPRSPPSSCSTNATASTTWSAPPTATTAGSTFAGDHRDGPPLLGRGGSMTRDASGACAAMPPAFDVDELNLRASIAAYRRRHRRGTVHLRRADVPGRRSHRLPQQRLRRVHGLIDHATGIDLDARSLTVEPEQGGRRVLVPCRPASPALPRHTATPPRSTRPKAPPTTEPGWLGDDRLYRQAGYTYLSRGRAQRHVPSMTTVNTTSS